MYELIYGFNIDYDYDPDVNEEILNTIEIDAKGLSKAEAIADEKFKEVVSKMEDFEWDWINWHIKDLGPWILRKDKYGCRIDGAVRKGNLGFKLVLRPVEQLKEVSTETNHYAYSDKDTYWQNGHPI